MVARTPPRAELRVSHVDGWVCVTVPYDRAEQWQHYFRARGIGSTLIRDPKNREASLDLWKRFGTVRVLAQG